MASNEQHHYDQQLQFLHECYPQESQDKLLDLLRKYHGNVEQVRFFEFVQLFQARKCLPGGGMEVACVDRHKTNEFIFMFHDKRSFG